MGLLILRTTPQRFEWESGLSVTHVSGSTLFYAATEGGAVQGTLTQGQTLNTVDAKWLYSAQKTTVFVDDLNEGLDAKQDAVTAATDIELAAHKAQLATNVKDYAATGLGIVEETTAFGLARDAAGVGGHVYVPPGTYVLDDLALSVARQRWTLAAGAVLKLKDSASAASTILAITAERVTIEGGEFNGNRANNAYAAQGAIEVLASHARLRDFYVYNSAGFGVYGRPLAAGTALSDVEVRGCSFLDCRSFGVWFNYGTPTVPSNGIRIISCWADNSSLAVGDVKGGGFEVRGNTDTVANQPRGCVIADCYYKSRPDATANVEGIGFTQVFGGTLKGCYAEGSNFENYCIIAASHITMSGCESRGGETYGLEVDGGGYATGVSITGCVFDGDDVTENGIMLNSVDDVTVSGGNVIRNLSTTYAEPSGVAITEDISVPTRITITGNEISAERGVYINGDAVAVVISDNLIAADTSLATRYGIVALPTTGGSKRWSFRDNLILDCDTTWLRIGGAGTMSDVRVEGNDVVNSGVSNVTGTYDNSCRIVEEGLVASVASAATVTLPWTEVVSVTGTTNITSITASWVGRRVTLKFAGILTLTDGSNLDLAGNFVTSADDTITLVCDGTDWIETGRSVN